MADRREASRAGCKECGYALILFRRNVAIYMSRPDDESKRPGGGAPLFGIRTLQKIGRDGSEMPFGIASGAMQFAEERFRMAESGEASWGPAIKS